VSVRGLTPEAAATLGAAADISTWSGDVALSLGVPAEVKTEAMGEAATTEATSASNPATASFYARQWHMRQIGANTAWAAGRLGSPTVMVGILDTGLDYRHPDLLGKVDLSLITSFVPQDNALIQQMFPGGHEIADLHYHGTHVGATISSNAVAAAGVTSRVTLVGIKTLDRSGNGNSFATLDAIVYAADIGLDVINMSLGIASWSSSTAATPARSGRRWCARALLGRPGPAGKRSDPRPGPHQRGARAGAVSSTSFRASPEGAARHPGPPLFSYMMLRMASMTSPFSWARRSACARISSRSGCANWVL
jgi:hypothetical protein